MSIMPGREQTTRQVPGSLRQSTNVLDFHRTSGLNGGELYENNRSTRALRLKRLRRRKAGRSGEKSEHRLLIAKATGDLSRVCFSPGMILTISLMDVAGRKRVVDVWIEQYQRSARCR